MATNGNAASPTTTPTIASLNNKIALITGGSSGLGRAIALAYAAAGAYIVSGDITPNPPSTPQLAKTIKSRAAGEGGDVDLVTPTVELLNKKFPAEGGKGERAVYVECDVTKEESIKAAVAKAVEVYGRLDVMVNNAGIATETATPPHPDGSPARLHETPVANLDRTFSINIRGVWLGTKYAVTQFLAQPPHQPSGDRGWIINMASIYGLVGAAGVTSYCTSKGAVTNLTKASALEYATDRIHINSIHPGFVETPLLEPMKGNFGAEAYTQAMTSLHPWGRLCWPEEIGKMAVFLAGDGASFITGSQFVVDGGFTAR